MLIEVVGYRQYVSMTAQEALKLMGELAHHTAHAMKYGHSSFGQGVPMINDGKTSPSVLNITVIKDSK